MFIESLGNKFFFNIEANQHLNEDCLCLVILKQMKISIMTQNKERVLDLVVMLNDYYRITDICSSVNLEVVCRKLRFCLFFF